MGSFTDAVGDAVRSGLCAYLRAGDNANSWFNELSPVDLPNFSRYWRGRLCDEDPTGIPPNAPPFLGGQCDGVNYRVSWTWTDGQGQPAEQVFQALPGPIVTAQAELIFNQLGNSILAVNLVYDGGQQSQDPNIIAGGNESNPATNLQGPFIVRSDGQPDICGDPPIDIPPFPDGGDTFPISVTYQDIDNNEVNLSGTVNVFAPVFAPVTPVTIFAPVRVDLGGIEFSGNIELSPDFNFDFGFPDSEIDVGDGGGDPDETDPDTETPTCTEGPVTTRIVGVIVLSTPGAGRRTTAIQQDPAPTLHVPRIATVHFCVAGRRSRGWDSGNDVKTRAAYLEAPANAIATDVRVGFEPGWSGRVLPIRVPI